MTVITVKLKLADREIEMPLPQAFAIKRLSEENPGSTWHFADCGCCACLHPEGDPSRGWLIGSDGQSEWKEHA